MFASRSLIANSPSSATSSYWSNQTRLDLYYLPPVHSRVWDRISIVGPHCTERRILGAHNTEGFVIAHPDQTNRFFIVDDWTYLPDLLFFNPYEYFVAHPTVESIWVERFDPRQRVRYVSDPSDVSPPELALVVAREELNLSLLHDIRFSQHVFFLQHQLQVPDASEFTRTLHDE